MTASSQLDQKRPHGDFQKQENVCSGGDRMIQLSTVQSHRSAKRSTADKAIWKYLTICFAFLALLLVLAPGAWGQDNATITGLVVDASGAVIPNASITLTNPATNQSRATVSNSTGAYRFPNLGVGTYTLVVTAPAFQKYSKTGIVVNVAQTVEAEVVLTVGS